MKMLKVLIALLVLLLSNTGPAFSSPVLSDTHTSDTIGHPVVQEAVVSVYESTPVVSLSLQKTTYTTVAVLDAHLFCSAHETVLGNSYLKRSKFIVPTLDVPDIIFPFHIFL